MSVTIPFTEQRDAVAAYIRGGMQSQGATLNQAINATTSLYFFDRREVVNLYRCITSNLPGLTKTAIVAHDFNGLAAKSPHFLPKSRQFEREA